MKKRVTGIGGVFLKAEDPKATNEWYRKHLGINSGQWGGTFIWRHSENKEKMGYTAWSIFKNDTTYTNPSKKDAMINYRVEDLEALLKVLKEEGVEIVGEMQVEDYGKFGWIMDPNGYKIELWEPFDDPYEAMLNEDDVNKMS
ncbi:MAG: VOC family protein [Balneola sp.]